MKQFLLLLLLLNSTFALSQGAGGIPVGYQNDAAVDLVYNGKRLLPDDADKLINDSKGRFDISNVNPDETSDLWKNVMLDKLPVDKNPVFDMDEVSYHSPVLTPSGAFRFNVQHGGTNNKIYTMMLSKTVHSVLLAKSLLRKIGYQIPDIKYVPRVMIKFKDAAQKLGFISYLDKEAMAGEPKAWIIEDLGDNKLLVQDLIIMDSVHTIYNLAVGVTDEMILGRRVLSSLAVPLSIVNLTESVNLLGWTAGVNRINENTKQREIALVHDRLADFQCSWDDARWISRRIEKLTRNDWEEIVASTHIPQAVQTILVEKIISRRNSVMKLFKIDAKEIKVDADVTNGVELVRGKLTQQKWPGFASRFAYGDPESPLEASEMRSFVKSRVVSTLLDLAVSQINQFKFMGTDIAGMNEAAFKKRLQVSIDQSIADQAPIEIPVQAWTFPTIRGQLIMSRNLVTGTYLGTDNLVQLVDTVGVAVGAGMFLGTMGIPTPLSVYGKAEALLVRTYAHLRPVTSIQKSLKYPFKNVFVPLVKMDYGRMLNDAANVQLDENASEEVKAKKIEAVLKPLQDAMEVGESLLVTDSLTTYGGFKVGGGYKQLLKASLSLTPGHQVVSRFHVHRKNKDEFHIYKDLGRVGKIGISFSLDSLIPILKVSMNKAAGNTKTKFFRLNLHPGNPNVLENISSLRKAIVNSSTAHLEDAEETKPFVLTHKFKDSTPSLNLLFWQWNKQNASTNMVLKNPQGDEKFFRRHYYGFMNGKNYQAYANAMISHWVDILFDKDAGLSESTGSNPGYSYKGKSHSRFLVLDEEVDKDGNLIEPFIKFTRQWNGWEINRKKAEDILRGMKEKYRYEFFNAPILNDSRSLLLYNINVNILFYRNGMDYLLKLDETSVRKIFKFNQSHKDLTVNPADEEERDLSEEEAAELEDANIPNVDRFLRFLRKYRKFDEKEKSAKANKYLLKAYALMEDKLTLKGITEMVGGQDNLYVVARIDGFREGDENSEKVMIGKSDKGFVSSSLGEYGSPQILGPVVQYQRQTDMLEGEFFIYWLMTRLL